MAEQENALSRALGRLFALAEDYPELKASDGFAQLHGSLVEIEDHIQYARRYYNGAVRDQVDQSVAIEILKSGIEIHEVGAHVGDVVIWEARSLIGVKASIEPADAAGGFIELTLDQFQAASQSCPQSTCRA